MTRRDALSLLVRIALSVGLLVLLIRVTPDFELHELLPDWDRGTPWWLAGAFALTLCALLLSVVRWYEVGLVIGLKAGFRRYLSHYLAGQFLSNFVPTTVGGDVVRVRRLSKDTGDPPLSFASVVIERLSGWVVLPAISLVGFAMNPGLREQGASTRVALIIAGLTLLGLLLLIIVAGNDTIGRLLGSRTGWVEWLNSVHLGLDSLRSNPRQIWRVLGAGFAYQIVLLLAAACAARAMGIEQVGPTALMAFLPAVLIVQVLPLGIGGLGVREGAFVLFFGPLGVLDERSVALGFLIYLLTLTTSIFGLPALIFGGRSNEDTIEVPAVRVGPDGVSSDGLSAG